ncbi:MAG: isoleucine--tRNA ligase [Rhodothermaceae bacterium]|nr:isoleucine--tRNA ligase [Rhodothermaceae bacterium]MXZ57609.1 isoleucine--tRNA ligase [Rhodothermaceae bacterium]MYB91269.1 isoleucine--tRNA ligase [Rhodothermaceae bacterium]MYD68911.1 isoleucine--tRNA ligase [Rhodothermaceae bacterium]MYG45364.1 isoleucine--tRNA ligase [Rhodothermaceae bacterium]
MKGFEEIQRVDAHVIEREIRQWWESEGIFQKSVELRAGAPTYTFYEGPPTANGHPGVHHVMARTIKDVFCRYHTMKGCRVERKAGWDTHGLPVEIEVEKSLGLDGHEDILRYGMAKFNQQCRESVLAYKGEWDELTRQMGYWVDLDHPYVTFETKYIETEWWLIKQIYDKGLLYKGHKIHWYSPGSGTILSSHEVSLGYKEVQDPSVTVRFRSLDRPDTYFLAWTTTPWTLISNAALAVGPEIEYVSVRCSSLPESNLILARARLEMLQEEYEVTRTMRGSELEGEHYEPLFSFFKDQGHNAWRVVTADFVSTEDGTGIVHIAPAFGADDYEVGQTEGFPVLNPINPRGYFAPDIPHVGGLWFKDADRPIIRDLRGRGLLHRDDSYVHNYPHDWRKGTPLMSYPVESWFIRTTAIRDRLVELNNQIAWQPVSIGSGRFGEWLSNNVDWALSRRRFWGTPLPVWVSDQDPDVIEVIGSIQELRERCGEQLPDKDEDIDLHRPFVDELTWPAPDGGTMRRVPETIDVWFDSGAMPFAQWHYPFENQEAFQRSFPADFIAEGVDQTRGWFYTLHAIAALVMDEVSFRNCVVGGLLLDAKGEKMSKTKGNTLDPFDLIKEHGADRVRWYMMSNTPPWEDLKFNVNGVKEVERKFFGTLMNSYSFFATYANIDGYTGEEEAPSVIERPELDRWILSRLHSTAELVDAALARYHPTKAARAVESFVTDLSNWYIRRSRRRFWSAKATQASESDDDKWAAYETVHTCLETTACLMAPIAPYYSEWLYQHLMVDTRDAAESVHLTYFPQKDQALVDAALEARMKSAQVISSLVLGLRNKASLNIRQPVGRILVVVDEKCREETISLVAPIILDEVNARTIEYIDASHAIVRRSARPNFRQLGRRAGRNMPKVKEAILALEPAQLEAYGAGERVVLTGEGFELELQPGDVEITTEGVEGWLVGQEDGYTVALDTVITEELLHEGLARESINRLQNLRKSAGFAVTDRIHVDYKATEVLRTAIEHYVDRVRNETLAITFNFANSPKGERIERFDIGEESLTLGVSRSE